MRLFRFLTIKLMRGEVDPNCLNEGWKLYVSKSGFLCAINVKEWRGWWIITDKDGNKFQAIKEQQ